LSFLRICDIQLHDEWWEHGVGAVTHRICRIQLLWCSYNVTHPIGRWMASTVLVMVLTVFVVFNSIQPFWCSYNISNWPMNNEHGIGDGSHRICRIQLLWRDIQLADEWWPQRWWCSHHICRIHVKSFLTSKCDKYIMS